MYRPLLAQNKGFPFPLLFVFVNASLSVEIELKNVSDSEVNFVIINCNLKYLIDI